MPQRRRLPPALALPFLLLVIPFAGQAGSLTNGGLLEFHLTFTPAVSPQPFTGRVYVMLSRTALTTPRGDLDWFNPQPVFARDVRDWRPGQPLVLDAGCLAYPTPLPKLPPAGYYVQAVMDFDRGARSCTAAAGNGYGVAVRHELDAGRGGPVNLRIDQVCKEREFQPTDRVKLVDIPSGLLTAFHGRPVRLRAGVVLPASFKDKPDRRFPVIYEIPGFGADHFAAFKAAERNATEVAGVEMLHVVLDPGCRLGHHVFADSANNGPYGRALVEELIPYVEREYRGLGREEGRFVTGHSSGGWSSLWLQVNYPNTFGGCWSTAPDPVDFRDFQGIDLARPDASMFFDAAGKPRPIARRGGKPALYWKGFSDMEAVLGHGGQLGSFEAVFSPREPDGRPRPLWDRASGAIDPEVARSWQRYDIRRRLERDWPALGPRLAGKLHVYVGDEDTYYLEGAVRLLKEALGRLHSDAVVEVFPGRTHSTLVDAGLRERIAREMAGRYRRPQAKAR